MRWVLSGVQSGRYLAPSSRALSRSSERKGFWKPLSTTTTPLRIFPISCGPARGALCSVPSPRGFPGTAPRAGAGTEAVAGVEMGTDTAEAKEQVQLALLGLNPSPFLPQLQSPSPSPLTPTTQEPRPLWEQGIQFAHIWVSCGQVVRAGLMVCWGSSFLLGSNPTSSSLWGTPEAKRGEMK